MQPTHLEISRACEQVLKDLFHHTAGQPNTPVPCDAIRRRVPMSDELWQRVNADLRQLGLALHDGDKAHLRLTTPGAAMACRLAKPAAAA